MKRIAELDGLRGIAAILIVAYHYSYPSIFYEKVAYTFGNSLDLFFVLSGFLISSIILSHVGEPGFLRAFYFRRSLRIWPIYYLLVGGFTILVAIRPGLGVIQAAPFYLTFTQSIQNYWFANAPVLSYAVGPTWSLAVEEQFYILWPLLVLFLGRRWMVPLAFACIAVGIAARLAGFGKFILITNCDGFAFGGLLAVVVTQTKFDLARVVKWLAAVSAITLTYLLIALPLQGGKPFEIEFGPFAVVGKTVVTCFFACVIGLIVFHAGSPVLAPLRSRWLRYLGTISYGIYLYHLTALLIAQRLAPKLHLKWAAEGLIAPAICLAMAAGSWVWIEKPILRLKDRFRYGRATATPTNKPEPVASLTTP